jgi:hypothetical protein
MRLIRTALMVLAAVLLNSAQAYAGGTKTYAPPGKAGTSEYSEVVPTSGGNVSTPAMGIVNKSAAQISSLGAGRAGARKLAKLGKQGAAAARFAEETAPAVLHSAHGLGGITRGTGSATLAAPSGGSAMSGITNLLGGSDAGGIGVLLPLLLAFGLGAAVAVGVVRMRRSRDPRTPGV